MTLLIAILDPRSSILDPPFPSRPLPLCPFAPLRESPPERGNQSRAKTQRRKGVAIYFSKTIIVVDEANSISSRGDDD